MFRGVLGVLVNLMLNLTQRRHENQTSARVDVLVDVYIVVCVFYRSNDRVNRSSA